MNYDSGISASGDNESISKFVRNRISYNMVKLMRFVNDYDRRFLFILKRYHHAILNDLFESLVKKYCYITIE